jgi:predicted dehydrogenase
MDFSFDIERDDWRLDPRRGGGALFDLGCYGINAARLFTGAEPLDVFARARCDDTGVDMTMGFELRFPGDVLALLNCSFECPDRNRIEVVGTRGAIELADGVLPTQPAQIVFRTDAGMETMSFSGDQYAEQIKAFCASVEAGRLVDPAEDGLANMKVLGEVLESARGPR